MLADTYFIQTVNRLKHEPNKCFIIFLLLSSQCCKYFGHKSASYDILRVFCYQSDIKS